MKTGKKILSLVLAMLLIFSTVAFSVSSAQDTYDYIITIDYYDHYWSWLAHVEGITNLSLFEYNNEDSKYADISYEINSSSESVNGIVDVIIKGGRASRSDYIETIECSFKDRLNGINFDFAHLVEGVLCIDILEKQYTIRGFKGFGVVIKEKKPGESDYKVIVDDKITSENLAGNKSHLKLNYDIGGYGNKYLMGTISGLQWKVCYDVEWGIIPPNIDADVRINFNKDIYEVYTGEKVVVSGNVMCDSGINDLHLMWKNLDPDGVKVEEPGSQLTISETELVFSVYIQGLKEGTYSVNLCDKNSTEFNTVQVVVKDRQDDYEEPWQPTPKEPSVNCNDTSVEYRTVAWFGADKWKTVKITGEIVNLDQYYDLEDISITIISPDKNIINFDGKEKEEESIHLERSIGAGKTNEFKCKAYVKRDYMPEGGSKTFEFECYLSGKMNGNLVVAQDKFDITITNKDYKETKAEPNKTVGELLDQMYKLVPDFEKETHCYSSGLSIDIIAVKSAMGLGDIDNALNLANMAYDLSFYLAGIKNPTIGEFGELFLEQLSANTEGEVDKIIDFIIKRLKKNSNFDDFIVWCCKEYGVDTGEFTKHRNHCPTDIIVVDEFGNTVLKIINDEIVNCDGSVLASVFESEKTFYLPTGINYEIKIIATDSGTMDYIVDVATEFGERRIIEYNDILLAKDEFYIASDSTDTTGDDVFDLVSEDGNIINADEDRINHNYTLEVTTEATHTTVGVKTFTCECGDTYTEEIAKLEGHTYTSEVTTEPTHTTVGVKTFTCECGDTYTEEIAKIEGHTYTSEVTTEPTHTTVGVKTFICECGDTYTEEILKLKDHAYFENDVVAPTCSEKGYTIYICECGASYKDNFVDMKPHTYENSKCINCGKTCSHMCHKSGFMGFIWKIVRFFWKLFKMNPTCVCGLAHY